jgi:predicted AAA+ superfamily ATPase
MIKKIKMNGVACFASDSSIEIELAKNNLLYGLNGSGKTTISRFLDYGNNDNFKNCTVEPDLFQNQDFKIFVYNEDIQQDKRYSFFFEKMSFKEIGDLIGITEGNAKIKVYRVLDKLKKMLTTK